MTHEATPWLVLVGQIADRVIKAIAAIAVLALMLVTMYSVVMRWFGHPVMGANEIVQHTMVVLIAFGLCITQMSRSHIAVDLLYERLGRRARQVCDVLAHLLIGAVSLTVAWVFIEANVLSDTSDTTATGLLNIPALPFKIALGLGFAAWGCFALVQIAGLRGELDDAHALPTEEGAL